MSTLPAINDVTDHFAIMNLKDTLPFPRIKALGIRNLSEVVNYEITVEDGYGVATHVIKFKRGGSATIHIGDDNLFNVATEGVSIHLGPDGELLLVENIDS